MNKYLTKYFILAAAVLALPASAEAMNSVQNNGSYSPAGSSNSSLNQQNAMDAMDINTAKKIILDDDDQAENILRSVEAAGENFEQKIENCFILLEHAWQNECFLTADIISYYIFNMYKRMRQSISMDWAEKIIPYIYRGTVNIILESTEVKGDLNETTDRFCALIKACENPSITYKNGGDEVVTEYLAGLYKKAGKTIDMDLAEKLIPHSRNINGDILKDVEVEGDLAETANRFCSLIKTCENAYTENKNYIAVSTIARNIADHLINLYEKKHQSIDADLAEKLILYADKKSDAIFKTANAEESLDETARKCCSLIEICKNNSMRWTEDTAKNTAKKIADYLAGLYKKAGKTIDMDLAKKIVPYVFTTTKNQRWVIRSNVDFILKSVETENNLENTADNFCSLIEACKNAGMGGTYLIAGDLTVMYSKAGKTIDMDLAKKLIPHAGADIILGDVEVKGDLAETANRFCVLIKACENVLNDSQYHHVWHTTATLNVNYIAERLVNMYGKEQRAIDMDLAEKLIPYVAKNEQKCKLILRSAEVDRNPEKTADNFCVLFDACQKKGRHNAVRTIANCIFNWYKGRHMPSSINEKIAKYVSLQ